MRRIIVSEFVTLDGVMETPEKWSFPFQNEETAKFKLEELCASDALLLGRATYQIFARSWPSRKGELAEGMNSIAKYVVSTTLDQPIWNNAHQIKATDRVIEEVLKLKGQPGQDILVLGSGLLLKALMAHGLVDEYRLMLHPIVLGSGRLLFTESSQAALELVETRTFRTGMVLLQYQPART